MAVSNLILGGAILVACIIPTAVLAGLGRYGSGRRAYKAFFQATRWIGVGMWIWALQYTLQEEGPYMGLILMLVALGSLTVAEYIILEEEENVDENFGRDNA